jgi:hypothetical protein
VAAFQKPAGWDRAQRAQPVPGRYRGNSQRLPDGQFYGTVPQPMGPSAEDLERKADKRFYASAAWVKLRDWYRARHPMCERCGSSGRRRPMRHVHHKVSRKIDPSKAFDPNNLTSLCIPCHSAAESRRD